MSISSVLLPHDGSDHSNAILDPLARLVGQHTNITVLNVDENREGTDEHLADVRRRLSETGATVSMRYEDYADPAAVILETASELRPDLVAMSTHGKTGARRWTRGSVAERVIRRCTAPVLAVNPFARPAAALSPILVPVDGSELSAGILDAVLPLARALDAKITLLRVDWPDETDTPATAQRRRTLRKEVIDAELRDPVQRVEEAGLEVETRIERGDPADVILRVADSGSFGLLAMSTHGRSGPSRWLLGSTAEKVLREVTLPVLVRRSLVSEAPD